MVLKEMKNYTHIVKCCPSIVYPSLDIIFKDSAPISQATYLWRPRLSLKSCCPGALHFGAIVAWTGRWPCSYRVCAEKWLYPPVPSSGSSAKEAAMGTICISLAGALYQQKATPGYQTLQCHKMSWRRGLREWGFSVQFCNTLPFSWSEKGR